MLKPRDTIARERGAYSDERNSGRVPFFDLGFTIWDLGFDVLA